MCMLTSLISVIISYFMGAVPTGYWFAQYFFSIDITKSGSGNIGATNVGRALGKKYFAVIFLIDFLKAFLTLYLISRFVASGQVQLILSAAALLVGNAYSIFLKFNGGKGVATTVGILAFLFPIKLLLVFICVWVLILVAMRRVFVASLVAAYFSIIVYYFCFLQRNSWRGHNFLFYLLIFICFWLTFRHVPNIQQEIENK